ncbi:hypothetical protein SMACR_09188 [Sordaria macrospora]|uniref:Uncharacterized protein n=1 Tax=Sordaria macrospora TaxID=5147 RepID=A0A8S8ZEV7_SORMA|nr:hypothetical protein SMACR_09188 [Sordaria macrospora]WPJ64233.1 hypothetical protein SMAC4_13766 [Sordaria macrospora]
MPTRTRIRSGRAMRQQRRRHTRRSFCCCCRLVEGRRPIHLLPMRGVRLGKMGGMSDGISFTTREPGL